MSTNYLLVLHTENRDIRDKPFYAEYHNFIQAGHFLEGEISPSKGISSNDIPASLIPTDSGTNSGKEKATSYPSVLHAILDGWTLLNAPTIHEDRSSWWLVRDSFCREF